MTDKHSCEHCSAVEGTTPGLLCYLNPTVRLLKFGQLYNSRIQAVYDVNDLEKNFKALGELERDNDYIFTLKHRPFASNHVTSADLRDYLSSDQHPYLEQQDILYQDQIRTINGANYKDEFKLADCTVVFISAPRCYSC